MIACDFKGIPKIVQFWIRSADDPDVVYVKLFTGGTVVIDLEALSHRHYRVSSDELSNLSELDKEKWYDTMDDIAIKRYVREHKLWYSTKEDT